MAVDINLFFDLSIENTKININKIMNSPQNGLGFTLAMNAFAVSCNAELLEIPAVRFPVMFVMLVVSMKINSLKKLKKADLLSAHCRNYAESVLVKCTYVLYGKYLRYPLWQPCH